MHLQDVLGSGYFAPVDAIERIENPNKQRKSVATSVTPASWGQDRVSISAEAFAAQKASAEQQSSQQDGLEDETDAAKSFSAYMEKARSQAQSGDSEKQLEALQNKLKGLQSQLISVEADKSTSEMLKQPQMKGLQSQIDALLVQIDELTASSDEEAS